MLYTDDYEVPVNCNVDRLGHNHMPQQNMYSIHTSQKICDFYPVRTNLHPSQYIFSYFSACRTNPQGQNALRTAPRD